MIPKTAAFATISLRIRLQGLHRRNHLLIAWKGLSDVCRPSDTPAIAREGAESMNDARLKAKTMRSDPSGVVLRPRLIAGLSAADHARIIMINGQPARGKSILAAEFSAQAAAAGCGWSSLSGPLLHQPGARRPAYPLIAPNGFTAPANRLGPLALNQNEIILAPSEISNSLGAPAKVTEPMTSFSPTWRAWAQGIQTKMGTLFSTK